MRVTRQGLLIALLGGLGLLAGLGGAMLAAGPSALVGTSAGDWLVRTVFTAGPRLPDGRAILQVGDPVPVLDLTTPDVEPTRLTFGERPVLVNFWASWCKPCIEELPMLDRAHRQRSADGLRIVAVALDEPDAVAAFLTRHPVDLPILFDEAGPNDSAALLGNVRGILPYSVLVDASGRLKATRMGALSEAELARWSAP